MGELNVLVSPAAFPGDATGSATASDPARTALADPVIQPPKPAPRLASSPPTKRPSSQK